MSSAGASKTCTVSATAVGPTGQREHIFCVLFDSRDLQDRLRGRRCLVRGLRSRTRINQLIPLWMSVMKAFGRQHDSVYGPS